MIIDLQKAIKFYELKNEIEAALICNCTDTYGWNGELENQFMALINKIEAIEAIEKEGE